MREEIRTWAGEHKRYLAAVVLVTAALTGEFLLFRYGILKIIRYEVLMIGLWAIAWIDGKEKRIPNRILAVLTGIRAILLLLEGIAYWEYAMTILISAAGGALVGGGIFLLCYFLARGGMGAGDVKLLAVTGFYMGLGIIFTDIFLSILIAALYSGLLLIRKKIKMKEEISFAPFVLAGTVLTMALGM